MTAKYDPLLDGGQLKHTLPEREEASLGILLPNCSTLDGCQCQVSLIAMDELRERCVCVCVCACVCVYSVSRTISMHTSTTGSSLIPRPRNGLGMRLWCVSDLEGVET